jgi:serine/threonine-protein kinase HipA
MIARAPKAMSGEVAVYVAAGQQDLLAGRMSAQQRGGAEAVVFSYDDSYLADPQAYPLDPALPLVAGTLQAPARRVLFGAFADSTPDHWGRSLIIRAERARAQLAGAAPRPVSELDVLLAVRDDLRQGALRYRAGTEGPFLAPEDAAVPALTDLPVLLDIAGRAERNAAGYEDLMRLLRAGGSLGGARPKAHVVNAAGRVAMAKFPSPGSDPWDVMAWEKVAHDLARDAGLTVPRAELIRVAGQHVFVVERFDRRGGARVGYASAMTMLQAAGRDQRSYLEIAEVIGERSDTPAADLRELWRRIAFSILISNTDDHLRNHGFLHERAGSWTLSPAFDLNPNPGPGPKYLTTAIDRTDTRASVDTLMRVAGHFRLDPSGALGVLAEVARAVAGWRAVATSHGLPQRDLDAMRPAFEHAEAERAKSLYQ